MIHFFMFGDAANSFALTNKQLGRGSIRCLCECRTMYKCTKSNVCIVFTCRVRGRILFAFGFYMARPISTILTYISLQHILSLLA